MVCFYSMAMHQCTFNVQDTDTSTGKPGSSSVSAGDDDTVYRFFMFSRAANAITCIFAFTMSPRLRKEALALPKVTPKFLAVAALGQ
jgi:hypothetical protein